MKELKVLAILLIVSCQSTPNNTFVGDQCHVTFDDADRATCQCRQYKVSPEFIGPLTKSEVVELSRCHKLTGYRPVEYAKLTNLMEWVRSQARPKKR